MCYTSLMVSNTESLGDKGFSLLLNQICEHARENRDGYSIKINQNVFRTLDINEFLNHIIERRAEIEASHLIHLHLRTSTNSIKKEYTHLWIRQGWHFSHNGIIQNGKRRTKNDSLDFLLNLRDLRITTLKEELEKVDGYGIFLFSHANGKDLMFASVDKPIQISYFYPILILSSDTWTNRKSVLLPKKEEINVFGLKLERENNVRIDLPDLDMPFRTSLLNVVGYRRGEKIKTIPLKRKARTYYYGYWDPRKYVDGDII